MPPILIFFGAVAAIFSPYAAIWLAQRRWLRVRRVSNWLVVACVVGESLLSVTISFAL